MVDVEIEQLLTRQAATWEKLDEGTWRAIMTSALDWSYRLFIHAGGGFVRAEISPFLALPAEPARAAQMMRELLHRNRTLHEARFALDDDDSIVIETVVEKLAPIEALGSALDALRAAAEAHFHALQQV